MPPGLGESNDAEADLHSRKETQNAKCRYAVTNKQKVQMKDTKNEQVRYEAESRLLVFLLHNLGPTIAGETSSTIIRELGWNCRHHFSRR